MKIPKVIPFLAIAFSPILPISANESQFDNFIFDQSEINQNIYEPKDKLDEYIIKAATYSTRFIPLLNDEFERSQYTSILVNDGKRLLVDAGFDFINSTVNSEIQRIPFFAQTSINISGCTESDTSFSINSMMKLG